MSKRRYEMTEAKIQKFLKEGRGTGEGENYMPWIYIHDLPSLGRVHRIFGLTVGREHHLLSDGEARFFNMCDWRINVTDIREQFPLNRDVTYRIAKQANIRHPITTDGTPNVLTSDFLLVMGQGAGRKIVVRTFKYEEDVNDRRVLEKFEIERRYWASFNLDWGIVTEQELDYALITNVEAVRGFGTFTGLRCSYPGCYQDAMRMILELIGRSSTSLTLDELCQAIDQELSVAEGTALIAAKYLIARKLLLTDMHYAMFIEKRGLDAFFINQEWEK